MVGPHVAASAAEAAVTALCEENEIPKEIFDNEENDNEPERLFIIFLSLFFKPVIISHLVCKL